MILKNAKIISPIDNLNDVLDIKIENGIITEISKNIDGDGIDFLGKIIVPGLIDMHCHLREPGFEYKETIQTGIESALSGGFCAICPMANTNPVIDKVETLKYTLDKANSIGFYPICAVTKGLKSEELTDIKSLKQSGAIAFSDDGMPFKNLKLFKEALKTGELIISHAEDEVKEVKQELKILKEGVNVGGKLHFAHISKKESIDLIRRAKKEGLNVTCETAPHYFTFTKDDVTQDGRFKMNPPLASKEDFKAIIEGLKDGTIDCIATDHAPHSLEEKTKPFSDAPFGIIGFETALSASFKLVQDAHLTMEQLIEKMSVNPAKILGLKDFGRIKVGNKANLTIIDPDCEYVVDNKYFKSKCKISPFEGMKLKGIAVATVVNGKLNLNNYQISSS